MDDDLAEKTITNGEIVCLTVSIDFKWFDVSRWDANGNNISQERFCYYADAKAEYDYWE